MFARPGGSNAGIDVGGRLSGSFDWVRERLEGLAEVLAKTDRLPLYCAEASYRTSYFYNQFPSQLVGDYENLVYAQPANDRCLTTSKRTIGNLRNLTQRGMRKAIWDDLPTEWGNVYNCFRP